MGEVFVSGLNKETGISQGLCNRLGASHSVLLQFHQMAGQDDFPQMGKVSPNSSGELLHTSSYYL
jgi:hypothetical protein